LLFRIETLCFRVLDKVLMGLIFERPKSGYELARDLEQWPILGLSSSQGSIHPALQVLLRAGQVERRVERDGARTRKAYGLTADGRRALLEWLSSPIALPRSRDEAIYRLLFLRYLAPLERDAVMSDYLARLSAHERELVSARRAHKEQMGELSPGEAARAADELLLLDFARAQAKFLGKWHKKKQAKRVGAPKPPKKLRGS
jgi:DNA-binding PadR family transcriptional regulator